MIIGIVLLSILEGEDLKVIFYRSKRLSQTGLYHHLDDEDRGYPIAIFRDRVKRFDYRNSTYSSAEGRTFFVLNSKSAGSVINQNIPDEVAKFIRKCRDTFSTQVLPFYFISKDFLEVLYERYPYAQEEKEIFIILPKEVETLSEIDFSNSDQTNMENIQSDGFPQTLKLPNQTLQLMYVADYSKNKNKNSAFLITRDVIKRVKSIVGKYPSRLYKIERTARGIIDKKLETNVIPQEISDEEPDKRPIALIVHGFMSFTEGNFQALKEALLSSKKYKEVFGYSYTPNKEGILENGGHLRNTLRHAGLLDPRQKLDIYAHSLGGLVSRSMIQFELDDPSSHSVRNFITAGTPHKGTPITLLRGKIYNPVSFPKHLIYILRGICTGMSLSQVIIYIANLFQEYVAFHNPGLRDLGEGSRFIEDINAKSAKIAELNISGTTFLVGYKNNKSTNPAIKLLLDELVFKNEGHDGVVPFSSSRFEFVSENVHVIDDNKDNEGGHSDYYNMIRNAKHIVRTVTT